MKPKHLFLLTIFSLLIFSNKTIAQAPSYTDFEWDVLRLGFAAPTDNDRLSAGISVGGEVRFNLMDYLSIGVGTEMAFFNLNDLKENEEGDVTGTVDATFSNGISVDYYFSTDSPTRGFVGLSIGHNVNGDVNIDETIEDDAEFIEGVSGGYISPRVGYEYSHLRFLLNYNIGFSSGMSDYISFSIAGTIWGGYNGEEKKDILDL